MSNEPSYTSIMPDGMQQLMHGGRASWTLEMYATSAVVSKMHCKVLQRPACPAEALKRLWMGRVYKVLD